MYIVSDSTVVLSIPCCLCRDGGGCLYAVIQTKSCATPEQEPANKPYHDEAGLNSAHI